jgi:hypothetical protein
MRPAGIGARLYAAVAAADDRIDALWAEWATLPRLAGGGIDPAIRQDFWDRLHQAQAERAEAASRCWGYFEGPECTALERAAWQLWDIHKRRWAYPR